ncbi:MAG: prepilin-type N-terminal cleavage/methylation domain-containing protein [Burkholderiales bacterium]|nr:prepilin-type N-terminal cleavage/methylation domain-containing protein [Burkholderiales bacterium]
MAPTLVTSCTALDVPKRSRGFTLIELLVALAVMAVMAGLSWRGIDGMVRAQAQVQARSDAVLTLQAGLSQWGADLDALLEIPTTTALDWDGRALRVTRRNTAEPGKGALVVAWTRRNIDGTGQWLRWQSAPLLTRGEWQTAWAQAAQWAQNPGDEERKLEVRITPLEQWSVFYYRNDSWSNPLSSDGSPIVPGGTPVVLPDGIRLVLTLPAEGAISGTLTRDWMRPTQGGNKS